MNNCELIDLNDFNATSIANIPVKQYKPFNTAVKESVIKGIKQLGRVEHDTYFRVAAAMSNAGMTLHDFLNVAGELKPSKTDQEHATQWLNSSALEQVSPGYLINTLRKNGIPVYVKGNKGGDDGQDNEYDIENLIHQLLVERQLYFVMDAELLFEYIAREGNWIQYKVTSFIKGNPFLNVKGGPQAFMTVLDKLGRIYRTSTLSAQNLPDYILNLFRNDHWLQPKEGDYHEVFDILIRSLGDNKKENMLHLEQVIAWKYLHPCDYNLPCPVIFGQGGAGKNSLIEGVLGTIFGKHQVIAITQESLKNFNGQIAGKMAVLLNESVANKADMEQLKAMIGQESLYINPKYMKPYVAENVSLYFTGGNGAMGAIFLGRDQSDRRFSILRVDRSIIDHVEELKGLNNKDAVDWWVKHKHNLQDKEQVARWLNHILTTIDGIEHTPVALHGQDYEELLDAQSGPFEWIVEQIFEHPDFKFISSPECFRLYELQCDEYGTRTRMNKTTFSAKLNEQLRRSLPHITYKKCQKVKTIADKVTTSSGWTNIQCKGAIDLRHISYITEDPRIKGKEVIAEQFFTEPEKPSGGDSSLDDYAEVVED